MPISHNLLTIDPRTAKNVFFPPFPVLTTFCTKFQALITLRANFYMYQRESAGLFYSLFVHWGSNVSEFCLTEVHRNPVYKIESEATLYTCWTELSLTSDL